MSKFLDETGLSTFRDWIKDKLSGKQDTLISGENIKTIGGESVLGSGNIDVGGDAFYATKDVTTAQELIAAFNAGKIIMLKQTKIDNTYPFVVVQFAVHNASHCSLVVYNVNGMTLSNGVMVLKYVVVNSTWTVEMQSMQNRLESGINIKTINNTSLLGSGNINIEGGSDVFVAKVNKTTSEELITAYEENKLIIIVPSGSAHTLWKYIVARFEKTTNGSCEMVAVTTDGAGNNAYGKMTRIYFRVEGSTWTLSSINVQDELVSGATIKTINNQSILGSGNIDVSDGGGLQNLVDGSSEGSVRGVYTAAEDVYYKIGEYSFAEGYGTKARGDKSHAEGSNTIAGSLASHAEGAGSQASGFFSHAEGYNTIADGYGSHAGGERTIASRRFQTAIGRFNIEDTEGASRNEFGKYAFIIGNGTLEAYRSNGFTVDWDGNVEAQGEFKDGNGNTMEGLQSQIDALGEPFRVKNWASNALNVEIPACTEDIGNTAIPKMVFSIGNVEGADYQIVGMLAYEIFDATSGGNRINCWPVCQFTGNGQKELSVRWMCAGTTRKTAKRINAWVLLKHR